MNKLRLGAIHKLNLLEMPRRKNNAKRNVLAALYFCQTSFLRTEFVVQINDKFIKSCPCYKKCKQVKIAGQYSTCCRT